MSGDETTMYEHPLVKRYATKVRASGRSLRFCGGSKLGPIGWTRPRCPSHAAHHPRVRNALLTHIQAHTKPQEMSYIWSPEKKFSTWRRLWIALAKAEKELGA